MPRPSWIAPAFLLVGALAVVAAFVGMTVSADDDLPIGWDAETGDTVVDLTGTLAGDSYTLSTTAKLHTDAQAQATTLEVWAARVAPGLGRTTRTPLMNVQFDGLRCSAPRSYVWQSNNGSMLTLGCDRYLPLSELDTLGVGVVESW